MSTSDSLKPDALVEVYFGKMLHALHIEVKAGSRDGCDQPLLVQHSDNLNDERPKLLDVGLTGSSRDWPLRQLRLALPEDLSSAGQVLFPRIG